MKRHFTTAVLLLIFWTLAASFTWAQSVNGSLAGSVTDASGAAVPNAQVTLTNNDTGVTATFVTGPEGLFSFPNLEPGTYKLKCEAKGFRDYVQDGILARVGSILRQDVRLTVGSAVQEVQVSANASPLNFENAEHKEGINPETIKELPLLVAGGIRSSAGFVSLLPGVTQGSGNTTSVHMNGAQQFSGEAILDGVSLVNPSGGNGIWSAFSDFPQSPDMIQEIQVLSSNYLPQYGTTSGATIIESIRSGTNEFHGNVFAFNRNTALNSRQFGATSSTKDIENEFGGNIGGPLKTPLTWRGRARTYFFVNFEDFRITGGLNRQTLSIPSLLERQGNFSDWVDSSGKLIPIYDPATTQANPNFNASQPVGPGNLPYLRQQFMGCDGTQPNVICPSDPRLQSSLAQQWFKFLPNPTNSQPTNNYLAPPLPSGFLGSSAWTLTTKIDEYIGEANHITASIYYKRVPPTLFTPLPAQISAAGISYKHTWVDRLTWDRTISPTLLNHAGFGYNDDKFYGGGIDGSYGGSLPQIPGVASHDYPPVIAFASGGFQQFGSGSGSAQKQPWLAPAYVVNDMVTWVKNTHTFTFGGEYRNLGNSYHFISNESGTFNFATTETGLLGVNSGSPIASFLLGTVDSGNATFRSTNDTYGRFQTMAAFIGDTWKTTSKLTLTLGLRWEMDTPQEEKWNRFSFLDPTEPNPGADNLPGALAFAGFGAGTCNCRHPEHTWHRGFAPRVAFAYAVSPKTVVRSGYGIFYDMENTPGWDSGISQDGYNTTPSFSSTLGGLQPAFLLSQGLPQTFQRPPFLTPTFDNGQNGPYYRAVNANRLPYSQQWNLTIEHQFTSNSYVSAAYLGNKGTRLLSQEAAINALNPQLLSMGAQLYDLFAPGQTTVDGVALPFTNFATTMQACAPSVAQALLAFPQYCSGFFGRNENAGNSTYHSFQLKVEHRFSNDFWFLGSYTNSKLITDSDMNQTSYLARAISPFQRQRNKSLALEDIPQALVLSLTYALPFGKGKRWVADNGIASKLVGGWTFSSIFRAQSGIPFNLVSSSCTVPSQFQMQCLPGLRPGQKPFAQTGSINPNLPLLNASAFEPLSDFSFFGGYGPRVDNFRQPGYDNHDLALEKIIPIGERVALHLRGEFFNVWNWHHFNGVGNNTVGTASTAFVTDLASPGFGTWNGLVTNPRNIQLSGRITF